MCVWHASYNATFDANQCLSDSVVTVAAILSPAELVFALRIIDGTIVQISLAFRDLSNFCWEEPEEEFVHSKSAS